jgi:hypothetical protein
MTPHETDSALPCTVCGTQKPLYEFAMNGKYRRTYCKACQWLKAKPTRQQKRETSGSVPLVCTKCHAGFERSIVLHARNVQRGNTLPYCSEKCFPRNPRKADDMSPFRKMATALQFRSKRRELEFTIDAEHLRAVWDSQNGVCPFTGWAISLRPGGKRSRGEARPEHASVDRVDQTRGYVKGNVRFVALIANFARHVWGDSDVLRFCKSAATYTKGG